MCIACEAKEAAKAGDAAKLLELFNEVNHALDKAMVVVALAHGGKRSEKAFKEVGDALDPINKRSDNMGAKLDSLVSALEMLLGSKTTIVNVVDQSRSQTLAELLNSKQTKH